MNPVLAIFALLLFVFIAATGQFWITPFLAFVTDNADTLEGLAAFIQIVLWSLALIPGGFLAYSIHQKNTAANPDAHLSQARQDELKLLRNVRAQWIDGILHRSLYQQVLLHLGQTRQDDAVLTWQACFKLHHEQTERVLPPNQPISVTFVDAGYFLLILGEPGAGKTITLLSLAKALLQTAEHDAKLPVPVVFNLASWAGKRLSLADWLVEELALHYFVPREQAAKSRRRLCVHPPLAAGAFGGAVAAP